MTSTPLFCPKCESENTDWLEQSETCAVCGHTYPTAVRREELSKEQLLPVLNISSTPPVSRIKITGQKIRVSRGQMWYNSFFLFLIIGLAMLKVAPFVVGVLLERGILIQTLLIFVPFTIGILYLLYLAFRDDKRQKDEGADSVISLEGDKILVFTELFRIKSETSKTLFPIEAEYIFYTLAGGSSAVRLSSQNRKGSIPLIENLQPAEARWLALYMRKYLQNHTIGA